MFRGEVCTDEPGSGRLARARRHVTRSRVFPSAPTRVCYLQVIGTFVTWIRAPRLFLALALGAWSLGFASPCRAGEPSSIDWHEEWPRFRPAEYAATAVLAAGSATIALAVPQPSPSWSGGILIDDPVRDGLRASSRGTREGAATASDVLLYTTLALPVLGDAAISAWAVHGNRDTAFQMALIEAESLSLAFMLQVGTKRLAARERPIMAECRKDPSYSPDCGSKFDGSFYSGHTSTTFTAAGLVCTNHLNLPLWGGGAADIAACVGALTMSTTTGILRIVSDRHYTSDVMVGAGAGLVSGMLVPWLLHYRGSRPPKTTFVPVLTPTYMGISVVGAEM